MDRRLAWTVTLTAAGLLGACAAGTQGDMAVATQAPGTIEAIDAGLAPAPSGTEVTPAAPPSGGSLGPVGPGAQPTDAPPATGATTAPPPAAEEAVPPDSLPFAVDEWFYPSGYMGDGELGGVDDQEICATDRPVDARGTCHRFTWTPPTSSMGWAGVYWQHPDQNWGSLAGLRVPVGASAVRFTAWGETGGEVVSFVAGMADPDGFERKLDGVVLSTTPTEYTLDLSTASYGKVVGGFGWVAEGSTSAITFTVDNITWE